MDFKSGLKGADLRGMVRLARVCFGIMALAFLLSRMAIAASDPSVGPPLPAPRNGAPEGSETGEGGGGDVMRKVARMLHSPGGPPLSFIENRGQVDERVKYYETGSSHAVYFARDGVYLAHSDRNNSSGMVRLRPFGMGQETNVTAEGMLKNRVSYFTGKNPALWKTDLPTYRTVAYRDIQPGVDVVFYGAGRLLEYDVVARPGSDISRLSFRYDGIERLELAEDGSLLVHLEGGAFLVQKKPFIYQEIDGTRREVEGRFRILPESELAEGGSCSYGFEVAAFDAARSLVIDPAMDFSLRIGGTKDDSGLGIALDEEGFLYITGWTASPNFPKIFPIQHSDYLGEKLQGPTDAFVMKIDSKTMEAYFSTYLGGAGEDEGHDLYVNASSVYVVGWTASDDFPTTGSAVQGNWGGAKDGFVARIGSDDLSTSLLYSSYLGGDKDDAVTGVVVSKSGEIFLTGWTLSTAFSEFATLNDHHGQSDAFFGKIGIKKGSSVMSSFSFIGDIRDDAGYGIAIDRATENVYVTGLMTVEGNKEALVKAFRKDGMTIYETTLNGKDENKTDIGYDIAVDGFGNAYVTGVTESADFASNGALQPAFGGLSDAFVAKVSPRASVLFATFLGGTHLDEGRGITVDSSGNVFVTGATKSEDFPLSSPFQPACGNCPLHWDAFIAKIDTGGTTFGYASFMGGTDDDEGNDIAVSKSGDAYVVGKTSSPEFTESAMGSGGEGDVFVTGVSGATPASLTVVSPNGGEKWTAGSRQTIQWSYEGSPGARVKVELLRAGKRAAVIASSTGTGSAGKGSCSWKIPASQAPGSNYGVRVTSTTKESCTDTSNDDFSVVGASVPPVASFSGSPAHGAAPLAVSFTDLSSGDITGWLWSFGDGATSTSRNTTHTYSTPGSYTVSLRVTGPGGSDTETVSDYVTVTSGQALQADFTASPTGGPPPLRVDFTSLVTGGATSWSWSFGDGSSSAERNPVHTYSGVGAYTVSLTARGASGSDTETKAGYIRVENVSSRPVVTVKAVDPDASEQDIDGGLFRVERTGSTNRGLVVWVSLSGTAANAVDYVKIAERVTFPALTSTVDIPVTPREDPHNEGSETVVFIILPGDAYDVGALASAQVTIQDNDELAVITVEATDPNASEVNNDRGQFLFKRTGNLKRGLPVKYIIRGTATHGTDYQRLAGRVTFLEGESMITVDVEPFRDSFQETSETVIVEISQASTYLVGSPNSATVTISDGS